MLAGDAPVPRHLFVPDDCAVSLRGRPLPIGHGQTISQPYIVAFMTEALRLEPAHRCSRSAPAPATRPRCSPTSQAGVQHRDRARLAETASARWRQPATERRGAHRQRLLGWPARAPFDRIIVAAAPPEIPQALVDQLAVGGVMVVPVGTAYQEIVVITKSQGRRRETRDPGQVCAHGVQAKGAMTRPFTPAAGSAG